MNIRWNTAMLLILLCFRKGIGQEVSLTSSLQDFQAALKVVRMPKNDHLLPLKDIDKRKIFFFGSNKSILASLQQYAEMTDFKESIKLKKKDVGIWYIEDREQLEVFKKDENVKKMSIVVILPDKLKSTSLRKMTAVILLKEVTELTQELAVQLVFGGMRPYGKEVGLPFRLGYAPPEYVGIDAKRLSDSISSIINYGIEQQAFPGAQVLVARKGKIIYHQAFGSPTYDKKRPLRKNDIYDMASLSKTTTALPILMKWYGEGRFDLEATMADYWPKFKGSNKENITWRNVLAHNAKLKPWIPYWKHTLRKHPERRRWRYKWWTFKRKKSRRYPVRITDNLWLHRNYKKKIFKAIRNSPLNKKQEYKYSGLAFYILPTMIEQMEHVKFESYLKQEIFKPLGANTLTYNPLRFFSKDRILPTELDTFFRMEQIHGTVHDEGAIMMGGVSGNAGLFGTANDMAKLWQLYLNKGQYGGKIFIKEKAVEEFTKCQFCSQGNHRGLGFDKPRIEFDTAKANYAKKMSTSAFGHAGYTGTLIWADPENDLLFIFLSNRVYKTRNNRKLYTLDIRPRLHNAIYNSIVN